MGTSPGQVREFSAEHEPAYRTVARTIAPSLSGQLRTRKSATRLTRLGPRGAAGGARVAGAGASARPSARRRRRRPAAAAACAAATAAPRPARRTRTRGRRGRAAPRSALPGPRMRAAAAWLCRSSADEAAAQPLLVEVAHDPAALDEADAPGLLADHDRDRVGLLGDAQRGAVARAEALAVTRWSRTAAAPTPAATMPVVADDHGAVVERRVGREDRLEQLVATGRRASITPVSAVSSRPVSRSITMSAPMRVGGERRRGRAPMTPGDALDSPLLARRDAASPASRHGRCARAPGAAPAGRRRRAPAGRPRRRPAGSATGAAGRAPGPGRR